MCRLCINGSYVADIDKDDLLIIMRIILRVLTSRIESISLSYKED